MSNETGTAAVIYVEILVALLGTAICGVAIYGLVLAFSASICLGIICLVAEPAPLIIGLAKLFWGVDLAQRVMEWIGR
jgi:hypothetical protein